MVILFETVYKNTIWGGNRLKTEFHLPCDSFTGEAWGISAHPAGMSKVLSGEFMGMSLQELWENHKELFGHHPSAKFPILVKIIDAFDDLSIQVHPNDEQALPFNSFGKNECWTILDADKNGEIIIGHHAKTMEEFMSYIEQGDYEGLINRIPCKKDDFFYIPAGTLHAICKGTLLLEVQQSSDLTYRFYDYHRLSNGALRELHLQEALKVVKIPDSIVERKLHDVPFDLKIQQTSSEFSKMNHPHGTFFVVLAGRLELNNTSIKLGDFGFVSSDEPKIQILGNGKIAFIHLL